MRRKRQRDYRAEYIARIQRGLERGLDRSVARGHPKRGQLGIRARRRIEHDALSGNLSDVSAVSLATDKRINFEFTSQADFLQMATDLGLTEKQAYSIWFSP